MQSTKNIAEWLGEFAKDVKSERISDLIGDKRIDGEYVTLTSLSNRLFFMVGAWYLTCVKNYCKTKEKAKQYFVLDISSVPANEINVELFMALLSAENLPLIVVGHYETLEKAMADASEKVCLLPETIVPVRTREEALELVKER
ncbi:hypothetical protein JXA85_04240 [Candidatus Woesearchaeota archaeon]|nr:hypothetical protein [Candidatus Woesearchaeota archaeon]